MPFDPCPPTPPNHKFVSSSMRLFLFLFVLILHINEIYSICLLLPEILFSILPSSSTHVAANGRIFSFFLNCGIVFHCLHIPWLLYLFRCQWTLRLFHVLLIINNAATNIRVRVSFPVTVFISFEYIPRSRISGSFSSSIFNFLMLFHTVFYTGCANLQSQQSAQGFSFFHKHANTRYHLCFDDGDSNRKTVSSFLLQN